MSAEELAAMDAKIVADTIAEMQRQIEQLTGARHSMYDPAVAIARDIALRTPPAMSADHIGDAGNMVAPVEAVAWRIRTSDGEGRFLIEDTGVNENGLTHWKECGWTVQPLYTHPAPIKPSGDTGELRERVARLIVEKGRLDLTAGFPPFGFIDNPRELADEILDLIQSERAG